MTSIVQDTSVDSLFEDSAVFHQLDDEPVSVRHSCASSNTHINFFIHCGEQFCGQLHACSFNEKGSHGRPPFFVVEEVRGTAMGGAPLILPVLLNLPADFDFHLVGIGSYCKMKSVLLSCFEVESIFDEVRDSVRDKLEER